jgi:RES domain-containing protein
VILWRISNYATLDGIGGTLQSARWHTAGKPIVYTADHPASALLELLANVDADLLPDRFQLLEIKTPDRLRVPKVKAKTHWTRDISWSRSIGDKWLQDQRSALLHVPSAILPGIFNTLINPAHPDAKRLRILRATRIPLDGRLK